MDVVANSHGLATVAGSAGCQYNDMPVAFREEDTVAYNWHSRLDRRMQGLFHMPLNRRWACFAEKINGLNVP